MGLIKKRLLFDRIVDGQPIPNGLSDQSLIDQYLADGTCSIYRSKGLPYSLETLDDVEFCNVTDVDTGVYPVCLHDPSFFTFREIKQLVANFNSRTLKLIKRGDIQLSFFIEEEPYKDVHQVITLCAVLYSWEILRFRIFSSIDPSEYAHTEYASHFRHSADNEFEISTFDEVGDTLPAVFRFSLLQYSENTYDWRVATIGALKRFGILDSTLFTYNLDAACLVDEPRIFNENEFTGIKRRMPAFLKSIKPHVYPRLKYNTVHTSSRFSIIMEAYLSKQVNLNYTYITEKSFRPLWWKQPFVVIGQSHTLRLLHRRGYRTFDHVINESYDTIEDDMSRLHAVTQELIRLNSLSYAEFDELIHDCQDVVDHNYAHFKSLKEQYIEHIFEERS